MECAVAAFLRWQDEGGTAAELLAAHPDLAEYLRPLLDDAAPAAHAQPGAEDGRVVGDYRLLRELGRGGGGVVFEARQLSLGRTVALKLLAPGVAADAAALARFRREATTAARLQHRGIVRVLEFGAAGGTAFLAMERVAGAPLDRVLEILRREPRGSAAARSGRTIGAAVTTLCGDEAAATAAAAQPAWRRGHVHAVADVALQVAEALGAAHAAGIVHRDVKPSNVLLCPDGTAVLTDFGLAREEGLAALTATGEFAGTPCYAAPEQVLGQRERVDARTDVFALGATLYELLTLQRAFDGASTAEVVARILQKEPRDPRRLDPTLPADLVAIVLKALEKDRQRRYASATAMAEDLRAFLDHRPVRARPPAPLSRVLRWFRREPLRGALATAGVLLLGAVLYVLATSDLTAAGRRAVHEGEVQRLLEEGYLAFLTNGPPAARERFAQVLAMEPANVRAIVGLTRTLGTDEHEAVLVQLDRARSVATAAGGEPEPALRRIRAFVLQRLGREHEAAAILEAIGPPRDATDLFVAGTLLLPRPGEEAAAGGLPDGEAFMQATALFQSAIFRSRHADLLNYVQLAWAAGRAGDQRAARECAAALRALWPRSAPAQMVAGVALFEQPAAAEAAFREALRLDPDLYLARRNLALTLMQLSRLDEALAVLDEAEARAPRDPEAWALRARVLHRAGRAAEAVAAARRAAELQPQSLRVRLDLAAMLERAGEVDAAFAEVAALVALAPRARRVHQGVLGLARVHGRPDTALREHRRWLALHPEDAAAHEALARFLLGAAPPHGDAAAALAAAREAARLSHGDAAGPLVTLAEAEARCGEAGAAAATAAKARTLLPTAGDEQDELRRRLDAIDASGQPR